MPLKENFPTIDDRRYDEIVAEARTRIARYTPEWAPVWTDVNDSDPGVTLVQVFAWLTEMLIYRLGKVPEHNYLKFLELLGIELNPAEPALAEIEFPLLDSFTGDYVVIPPRTQVSADPGDGEAPIIFETERSLIALAPRLVAVQAYDGYDFENVTDQNNDAQQGFEPFGSLANPDSALMLGFRFSGMFPQTEINLAVIASGESFGNGISDCSLPRTQSFPPVQIAWEFFNGTAWRSLSLLKDETRALTQSGHIHFKTPAKGIMKPAKIGRVDEDLYWIRGRIERGGYERPPGLLAIRTNTVAAEQAETVRDEVLGGSNGRPNQVFQLANNPVLHDSLKLEVDEGDGFRLWTLVNDLFGSSAIDQHYMLNRTTGEIRFGDGMNGAIPVGNINNPTANVVAREYRFGGGKKGNLPAGTLKTPLTSITGIDENGIRNLRPAHSGRDEETLKDAKLRAQKSIKSKCRAVAEEDFETLAKQAANIKRAKALPLYHPRFPGVKVPGVVTVIVVPDSDAHNPKPGEGTLRTVCAYLNQRRLLTTELYVISPVYKEVKIRAEAVAQDNADLGDVKQRIEAALLNYFHPLKGGEDGQGWPFGGNIFFSRVFQQIFSVAGVKRIESVVILVDGEESPRCEDVSIPDGMLLFSVEHDIQVNYSFEE